MSLSTLRTQVRQLSQALHWRGEIVVMPMHDCQTTDELEAKAQAALGRERRAGDLLVCVEITEEPCPRRRHQHDGDTVILHHRID
jgi:hypothetical protein